jgi:3-methyl-2-oxobutanoate hydroxymethyltransferase
MGGFKVQGRGEDAARVLRDAKAVEQAGAFALVIEGVPPDVAKAITREVSIPTIGIGAGPNCDGQVLVCTDLLGMSRGPSPKFVKRYAAIGDAIIEATKAYAEDVRNGAFPGKEHTYKANESAAAGTKESQSAILLDAPLELDHWH